MRNIKALPPAYGETEQTETGLRVGFVARYPGAKSRSGGRGLAHVWEPCAYPSRFSMLLRSVSGLMSVHTSLMYSRHSAFDPLFAASFQPAGFSRSAGQIEYCPS